MHDNTLTPLLHPVFPDACRRIGIGKTKMYELVSAGRIKTVKIGRKCLVPETELQRLTDELLNEGVVCD